MVSLGGIWTAAGLWLGPGLWFMYWKNRFWSCRGWASFWSPPKPKPKGLDGSWGTVVTVVLEAPPLLWEVTSPNTGAATGRPAGARKACETTRHIGRIRQVNCKGKNKM